MCGGNSELKDCDKIVDCTGRREFLVKSVFVAGGLILSLKAGGSASARGLEEVVVPVGVDSPLSKVGGSAVVASASGKIIVVRKSESEFVAFSAVCTHKRGIVEYEAAKKQFVCPKHGSTFDGATGAVVEGPADDPLPSYKTKASDGAVTVTVGS